MRIKKKMSAILLPMLLVGCGLNSETNPQQVIEDANITDQAAQYKNSNNGDVYLNAPQIADITIYLGKAGNWKEATQTAIAKYNAVEGTTVNIREVSTLAQAIVVVIASNTSTVGNGEFLDCSVNGTFDNTHYLNSVATDALGGKYYINLNSRNSDCGFTATNKLAVVMHEFIHMVGISDADNSAGNKRVPGTQIQSSSVSRLSSTRTALTNLDMVSLQTMWPSPMTLISRFDFSPEYYLEVNPDVAIASGCEQTEYPFCGNFAFALTHFQLNGIKEGRVQSPFFDPKYYLQMNPDIDAWAKQQVLTTEHTIYYWARYHWVNIGIFYGRVASPVFNPLEYLQLNSLTDAAVASGSNIYIWAHWHWANVGINEARPMNSKFNPYVYIASNVDLQGPVWLDWSQYFGSNESVFGAAKWQAILRAIAHYQLFHNTETRKAI